MEFYIGGGVTKICPENLSLAEVEQKHVTSTLQEDLCAVFMTSDIQAHQDLRSNCCTLGQIRRWWELSMHLFNSSCMGEAVQS